MARASVPAAINADSVWDISELHCNAYFGLLLGLQRLQGLVEGSYQHSAISIQPKKRQSQGRLIAES
jgi:hypothetical protein